MSIEIKSAARTGEPSAIRNTPGADRIGQATANRPPVEQSSVVANTRPDVASAEAAQKLVDGILTKEGDNPGGIAVAQSGLSEQRVLELLTED